MSAAPVKRVDKLTQTQRDAIPAHVAHWIAIGQATGPADWATVDAGIRDCYRYTGLTPPRRVIHVPSPLVLSLAAPIAAYLIAECKGDAVRTAVRAAVRAAVRGAVHDAVGGAVRGAVHDAVHGAVRGAVGGAVRGAVDDAVDDAVKFLWYYRIGGQWWANWAAWTSYFRDICDLDLPGDLWDRDRAYAAANQAGWWWPHRQFVMVADRPRILHLEQVGPAGWGSHRLHCADGPAIAWSDGWALHYWHGVRVPADLITPGWSVKQILACDNAEVRRCAIERVGWAAFIDQAGLRQVGAAEPDPGNPGHTLTLYDVPEQIYDEPVRVLLCTNATPERDGHRRRFGLTVPADINDPIAAAAWTFDVDPTMYRQLTHAY